MVSPPTASAWKIIEWLEFFSRIRSANWNSSYGTPTRESPSKVILRPDDGLVDSPVGTQYSQTVGISSIMYLIKMSR